MDSKLSTYKWLKIITSLYIVTMFLVFPLYYQNNYINMLEAKTSFFVVVTVVYLVVGVISIIVECLLLNKNSKQHISNKINVEKNKPNYHFLEINRLLVQDVFFIVFVCAVIIATLLSGDVQDAWIATDGKLFGTKIIILCCGIYLLVSRGYVFNKALKCSLFLGMSVVFILAIFNRYGMDPLNMYSNIIETQKFNYLSTIGNVNILSNFVCIFVPIFMGMYLYAEYKNDKTISIVMLYLSVTAGIASNSDSFFLGLGASVIFYLWFSLENKEKCISYIWMIIICAISPMSIKVFNEVSLYLYKWNTLQLAFIYDVPWLILVVILVIAAVILKKMKFEFNWKNLRIGIFVLLGIGTMALAVIIIKVNAGTIASQNSYFTFSDEWGTNRGYVWSRTIQLFADLPFYQQLIGIGPGEFKDFFATFNIERTLAGLPEFVDPHSEELYYLVITGVMGVIGYVGMIISAIVSCVRKMRKETIVLAAIFVSWFAQGLVNNPLVFVTPYLFLFLGMSRHEILK